MASLKTSAEQPTFLSECTLGRLSKWLRLAGFDTRYDSQTPDVKRLANICSQENRILLTRTQRVKEQLTICKTIFIPYNDPVEQFRLVAHEMSLKAEDLRPLTRCARCNHLLEKASKEVVTNKVPEYVMQTQETFKHCTQCGRIYWPGTHVSRWLAFMNQML